MRAWPGIKCFPSSGRAGETFAHNCAVALLFIGTYYSYIATKRTFYNRSKKENLMVILHFNLHELSEEKRKKRSRNKED